MKNSPRLRLRFKLLKMKPERHKRLLKRLKSKDRVLWMRNRTSKMRSRRIRTSSNAPRRELVKLKLIWRRLRRKPPTGRNRLRKPRKEQQRRWLTPRLPPRNTPKRWRPRRQDNRLNWMQLSRSKEKNMRKLKEKQQQSIRPLKRQEKPERLNKLPPTRWPWPKEELNSPRSSETYGPAAAPASRSCR